MHVNECGVVQTPRAKLDMFEDLAVGAQSCVIIDTAGHVRPMTWHHLSLCDLLKVKNVQRACWIRDEIGRGRSTLCCGSGSSNESAHSSNRSNIGTRGEELKELTTGYPRELLAHAGKFYLCNPNLNSLIALRPPVSAA